MKVSMIAAVADNGTIGLRGGLPWKLRDDMRFFVQTTRGHTVITGRLNFEAMGKPLPGRRNIVLSRDEAYAASGCELVTTIEESLRMAEDAGESEAFIIGGAQIYALGYPYSHVFYRTRVLASVQGDVFFPDLDFSDFDVEVLSKHASDADNEHPFSIERLTRRSAPLSFRSGASLSFRSGAS